MHTEELMNAGSGFLNHAAASARNPPRKAAAGTSCVNGIVQALIGKGAALGTVLAFMMSVIALSAPEMMILRKVLKPTLIATFAGIVALAS
jgi:hypothetical protein